MNEQKIEWDGVGLPPVGTVCIVNTQWTKNEHVKQFDKQSVLIVMHDTCPEGNPVAVFKMKFPEDCSCDVYHGLVAGYFKPIKSEREKAVEKMFLLIGCYKNSSAMVNVERFCNKLYDAGLRFTDEK